MATARNASTTGTKLIELLKADIKMDKEGRDLAAAEKAVKVAQRATRSEVEAADDAIENAEAALEATLRNANSTGRQIMEAQRAVTVARANHEALKAIYDARF